MVRVVEAAYSLVRKLTFPLIIDFRSVDVSWSPTEGGDHISVYTKTGDAGRTGLFSGERVEKSHNRVAAYGEIDELNCFVGQLRDAVALNSLQSFKNIKQQLECVQNDLFNLGSLLSFEGEPPANLQRIESQDVLWLEECIDSWTKQLRPLKSFILPGGHPLISGCHVCRAVCRRAERTIVGCKSSHPIDGLVLIYVNRLSDFFFVLARYCAYLLEVKELHWNEAYRKSRLRNERD